MQYCRGITAVRTPISYGVVGVLELMTLCMAGLMGGLRPAPGSAPAPSAASVTTTAGMAAAFVAWDGERVSMTSGEGKRQIKLSSS